MLLWFTIALLLAAGRASQQVESCPEGLDRFDCLYEPCEIIECPNHPDASCHNNYCGGCFAEYYLEGIKLEDHECQVPCDDGYWTEWFNRDDPGDYGDYETIADLHREYPEKLCHKPIAIDAVALNVHKDYRSVGQIVTANVKKGFVCANKHNPGGCCDYKVRFCCPHVPYCKGNSWTKFYNGDDPEGVGDFEYLGDLRKDCPEEICAHPTAIHARSVHSKLSYKSVGQEVTINPKYGFSCFNKDQKHDEYCYDYEVSFCCPKEPEPYCPKEAWTEWYNRDKPSKTCDCETLDQLWKEHPEKICEHPTSIDVRVASTGDYYWKEGQNVIVSPYKGFQCNNAENSRPCLDYKVRFCCPEEIDHIPPPKCRDGHWSPYFNRDDSTGKGDFETLALFHSDNPENICENPSAIDVRFARNGASYLSNLQNVVVNLKEGFYCENKGQKCEDYKVRFCCPDVCEKKCLDGYWTRFFDIDDPDDNSDHEAFDVIRHEYPTEVCGNPTDIDARLLNGDDYTTAGQDVEVSLAEGFLCENEAGRQECCDYKVRFCCPKIEPKCIKGEWTDYQNTSPTSTGDYESNACDGSANSIDVKLADGRRYTAANQVVHISPFGGFKCINDEQPDGELCQDYKARFCCNEEPLSDNYHTCTISGDPHYYTLDGKPYDFQGDCLYNVLSTTGSSYETCLPEFSVWAQNEYRGNDRFGNYVTIVGKVIIRFSGQEIILFKDGTASVNGNLVTADTSFNFYGYSLDILPSGSGVTLDTDFELTVTYKHAHHLQVLVSESYFDEVEGLCGNFNGNPDDDFTLKGTSDVVPDVNEFALSFALDEPCVDPPGLPECEEDLENEAEYFCETLLANICFDSCVITSIPSKDDILRDCVYDYCYGEVKRNALIMTAQSANIQCESDRSTPCANIEQAIDETFCDDNEEFQQAGCEGNCEEQNRVCADPDPPGCRCVDGYVRSISGICILAENCNCIDPSGTEVLHGDPFTTEDCDCLCDEGSFECTEGICPGTCGEDGLCRETTNPAT